MCAGGFAAFKTLSLCPQLQDLRDLISVLDGSVILPSREAVMATATETAVSDVDGESKRPS